MKLNPKIYLTAAEYIATGNAFYACTAIGRAVYRTNLIKDREAGAPAHIAAFAEVFKPERAKPDSAWYGPATHTFSCLKRELALLFMYEIAKDMNND